MLIIAAISLILLCIYPKPRGPLYAGRNMEYWFTQLPPTLSSQSGFTEVSRVTMFGQTYGGSGDGSVPLKAFDSFGSNAIPFLLKKFLAQDSFAEQKISQLANRYQMTRWLPFRDAYLEHAQAVTCLIGMTELPRETLEELDRLRSTHLSRVADHILRSRDVRTHQ